MIFRNLRNTLFVGLLLALAIPTWAQSTTENDPGIESLRQTMNFEVLRRFSTPAPGMNGYVVKGPQGRTGILYGLGDYVISGSLLDKTGQDLTKQYASTELPKPDYADAARKLSASSSLVTEGPADKPEIYVFSDPNCPYCHKFWQQTRDWVDQGKVRIHWIMVGFLKPSSSGYAATILSSDDPVKTMNAFESRFNKNSPPVEPMKDIPDDLRTVINQHGQLMADLGFSGTPGLFFQNTDGTWQAITGLPDQARLAQALGVSTP